MSYDVKIRDNTTGEELFCNPVPAGVMSVSWISGKDAQAFADRMNRIIPDVHHYVVEN